MKCIILLFSILLLSTSCAGPKKSPEQVHLHLRVGTGFLETGNYPAAYRELKIAQRLDPENPVVHNNLGLTYYARNRMKKAVYHFKRSLELSPHYSDARNNLGRLFIVLNRIPEAKKELNIVLDDLTYSAPEKAHVNLGLAHLKVGELKEAQSQFIKAMQLNRSFCPAYNQYGQTLYKMRSFKKASEALDQALKVCKNFDEPHYYSALSYLRSGSHTKAKARFEEIVEHYPNSEYLTKSKAYLKKLKKQL